MQQPTEIQQPTMEAVRVSDGIVNLQEAPPPTFSDAATSAAAHGRSAAASSAPARKPPKKKKRTRLSDLLGNDNELVRPYSTVALKSLAELRILFAWKRELLLQIQQFSTKFRADAKNRPEELRSDRSASKWKIVFANMVDMLEDLAVEINTRLECARAFEKRFLSKNTRAAEQLTTGTGIEWAEHMKQQPKWLDEAGELVRHRIEEAGGKTRGLAQIEQIPAKSMQLIESFGRILLMMESHARVGTARPVHASPARTKVVGAVKLEDIIDDPKERERRELKTAISKIQEHVERVVKQRIESANSASSATGGQASATASKEQEELHETLAVIEQNVARVFSQTRTPPSSVRRATAAASLSTSVVKTMPTATAIAPTSKFRPAGVSSNIVCGPVAPKLSTKPASATVSAVAAVSGTPLAISQPVGGVTAPITDGGGATSNTIISDFISPVTTPLSTSASSSQASSPEATAPCDVGRKKKRTKSTERLEAEVAKKNKLLSSLLGTTKAESVDVTGVAAATQLQRVANDNQNKGSGNQRRAPPFAERVLNHDKPTVVLHVPPPQAVSIPPAGYFLQPPAAGRPQHPHQFPVQLMQSTTSYVSGDSNTMLMNAQVTNFEAQQQQSCWSNGRYANFQYVQTHQPVAPQQQHLAFDYCMNYTAGNNGSNFMPVQPSNQLLQQQFQTTYSTPNPPTDSLVVKDDSFTKLGDADFDDLLEMVEQNQQDDAYFFQSSSSYQQHQQQPLYNDNNMFIGAAGGGNLLESESPTAAMLFNTVTYNNATGSNNILPPVSSLTQSSSFAALPTDISVDSQQPSTSSMQQLQTRHQLVMQQARSLSSASGGGICVEAANFAAVPPAAERSSSSSSVNNYNRARSRAFESQNQLRTMHTRNEDTADDGDFRSKSTYRYASGTSIGAEELPFFQTSRSSSSRTNTNHETTPTPVFNVLMPPFSSSAGDSPPENAVDGSSTMRNSSRLSSIAPQLFSQPPADIELREHFAQQQIVTVDNNVYWHSQQQGQIYYPTPPAATGSENDMLLPVENIDSRNCGTVFDGGNYDNSYGAYSGNSLSQQQVSYYATKPAGFSGGDVTIVDCERCQLMSSGNVLVDGTRNFGSGSHQPSPPPPVIRSSTAITANVSTFFDTSNTETEF